MESVLDISAHKYGNYHKYYTFHPSSARISFFSSGDVFRKLWDAQGQPNVFSIIDIGCNEGNLSVDVLEQAKKELPPTVTCTLLGIDLDSSLIDLAVSKYVSDANTSPIAFQTINFMDPEASKTFLDNYLSELSTKLASKVTGFSMVCLFSITMWIHLNFGDGGLVDFLTRSAELLTPTGSLVVEPQPWKCYKAADKRCRKLGITRPLHYSALAIREIESEMLAMLVPAKNTAPVTTAAGTASIDGAATPAEPTTTTSTNTALVKAHRQIDAGFACHWDLGKEGWGRTIYLFHRSEALEGQQPPAVVVTKAAGGSGSVGAGDVSGGGGDGGAVNEEESESGVSSKKAKLQ